MQPFHHFLAWYLGLKAPDPGEGTAWHLDWQSLGPTWLIAVATVGFLCLITWVCQRDGQFLNRRQRLTLILLRVSVFSLVVAMLTELSLTVERTGLPSIAVMIDVSASMSLQDQYPPSSQAALLVKSLALTSGEDTHRLALAQHVLTRNGERFLRKLQENHRVRLYRFAEIATPLDADNVDDSMVSRTEVSNAFRSTVDDSEHRNAEGLVSSTQTMKRNLREDQELPSNGRALESIVQEIQSLRAEGKKTRLAPSVKKVLDDLRGTPPTALIVFTDGIASVSDDDKLSMIAEAMRRKGIPLHVVGFGSNQAAKDLQLYDTLVDEIAFVDDPIQFQAKIRGSGYADQQVLLRLRHEGDPTTLTSKEITISADGQPQNVEMSYTSTIAGDFDFILEVVPSLDEPNTQNNMEARHISVRDEKIRVLLTDAVPRYEFRYLKQLLERDKSIELSTLLQDADVEYAQEDRTAIQTFPLKHAELSRFDVVIVGDISPVLLGSVAMQNLCDFVREKGGSVAFIAGSTANPQEFAGTPLEILLPFAVDDVKMISAEATSDSFRPTLTLEGQKGNSLFRFGDGDAESLRIWNQLPKLNWFVEILRTKPGVRVFAEHPTKAGKNGKLPLILLQHVGAGKVLFHATDETWRWRFRTGDLYFGRYWIQAMRSLSRGRLIGKDRTAELTVDQLIYQLGEPVSLRVRFVDEKFLPTHSAGVTVTIEHKGEGRRTIPLTRSSETPMNFEAILPRLPEGSYHAWISQPVFNESPPATDFRVESPQRELQRRDMDKTDLQRAAKLSHGRFYTLEDADQLPSEIPRGMPILLHRDKQIPLWNRGELMSLFAVLLTIEWLLRKRWRLA